MALGVALEDLAKQLLGPPAVEKMRLVGRALIGVARRHRDPVDAHLGHRVEEPRDPLGFGIVEQGRIDVDPKPARLDEPDRFDRAVVDAGLAHRAVVVFAVAIEVDGPGEEPVRREQVDLFLEQQRVGAQIDELLAGDDRADDLVDLVM